MSSTGLFWVKAGLAMVVLTVGLAGAFLPWALGGRGGSARALALGDTFAGGVLGGAGLIHLLGDGIDGFRATVPDVAYPIGLLLAGVGFLLILLIEGVVALHLPADRDPPAHSHSVATQHEVGWSDAESRPAPYPLILLIVLSVHSMILGLALGGQQTAAGATVVFIAIVAHKGVAGFALGVSYYRNGLASRRAAPEITIFAVMAPLGILAGSTVGVLLTGRAEQLFVAAFDSLGAGTFLYIAALDIIKTEFDSPDYRGQKWVAAALGFGCMALLALWL